MKIMLKNKDTGVMKEVKVGFSWTTLLFGTFTPLVRGDWKWAIIQFIAAILSYGASHILFAFIYNKIYIKDLLNKGYVAATETGQRVLEDKGYIAK